MFPIGVALPFTEQQFLDVFGVYNTTLWPALIVLWAVTGLVIVQLVRAHSNSVSISVVATVHWAWTGLAYHAWHFSGINRAAWLFAVLFLAQALGFLRTGVVQRRLVFDWAVSPRHMVAATFLAYSFLYPVFVLLTGHTLPRAPLYGVPCPTALLTTGLLFAARPPVPRFLLVIPIAWSLVGGSAALLLRMTPDVMLLVGAALMLVYVSSPKTVLTLLNR